MHYQNQRVTTLTTSIQAILDSADFERTVSTGVDYYRHLDRVDLNFTSDGEDVYGTYESIEWLRTQARDAALDLVMSTIIDLEA